MSASIDLFGWMDALWTKKKPEGKPPTFMMHRFMASDREMAEGCRVLQRDVRDPEFIFGTWQALLPVGRGAPRYQYVVAKKAPEAEALTLRMMHVLAESRETVEAMISLVDMACQLDDLYEEFGIEP